ncbi:MAG: nucleotide exchange factor GrpE [Actinobacteria bacterium]|nr:nucleotide exchange factor GrpE [Actinomycetota bacterium]
MSEPDPEQAEALTEEDPAEADVDDAEVVDGEVVDGELIDVGAVEEEEIFVDGTVGRSDIAAERDEYKEAFLRVKADFENYKKRADKNLADRVERAMGQLVTQLLPILDAFDAALDHGAAEVDPIYKTMLDTLEREGLERLDPVGEAFDPTLHEAVMHEEGEPGEEPSVVASLRIGYAWKGKVIRPAMVKVKG